MSTYDYEPDPDDYGPEPPHIANPSTLADAMLNARTNNQPTKANYEL